MEDEKNVVRLGIMPPLTGLVGIYGEEISCAAQIACNEINEGGGVLGKQLSLVIEDDGSLPESAVIAANKLLDQHRCVALIGNLLSNSRIAVAYRVAEPRKVPYLNFSFYEGSIQSRYFFNFAALPNQQIDRMIPYMRNKFGPRMFFAGNNYEWPRGSIDAAKKALLHAGGEVVGEEYCPIGVDSESIEHLLNQIETVVPDVFVPYFAGNDQVNLLTRFTERGLKSRMAVVMGHYDEIMTNILTPQVREGFYSNNTYFMSVDSEQNREYLARLKEFPGIQGIWPDGNGIMTNFGEGTYACVKAFAQAANAAGSLESEALMHELRTIRVLSPQGTLTMNPEHQHATVNTYLSQCRLDGTFKIIESFGAIKPMIPEHYNHQRISNQATLDDDIRLQSRMLEQMSEAVLLVNSQNGFIIYLNTGAQKIFGYDKTEIIDQPIWRFDDPDDSSSSNTSAEIFSILKQKGVWEGETRYINNKSASIYCSVSISTFTHPVYGEVWLWVASDISERKQTEAALGASESLLKEAQKIAMLGSWEFDLINNKLSWSDEIYRIFELDKNKFELSYESFLNAMHPDDRDSVNVAYKESLDSQKPYSFTHRLLMPDGRIKWLEERCNTYFDEDGKPLVSRGSVQDITNNIVAMDELRNRDLKLKKLNESLETRVLERTAEVQQQNRRNETILSTAIDGFLSIDINGHIQDVNPAFCDMLGFSKAELIQMTVAEIEANESTTDVAAHINKILAQGYDRFDTRHRCKDGTNIEVEVSITLTEFGGEKMFYAFARDITPRKLAEIALREQVQHTHAIVDNIVDGIITINKSGIVESYSPAAERIFGYSAEEVLGNNVSMLMPNPYRDEHDSYLHNYLTTGVAHIIGIGREVKGMRRDGNIFPIELSISKITHKGKPTFVGMIRDVTRRQEAAKALSEITCLLNAAQEITRLGSFDWDIVSGELHWSDEHYRLWNLTPRSVKPDYELFLQKIHPDDVERVEKYLQQALKLGIYDCVHRVLWPDENPHYMRGLGEVTFNADGHAIRMIGTIQDITEQISAEQALITARNEADRANKAKSEFLASMSHELRTPLNAILGFSQLLETEDTLAEQHRDNIREIITGGEHLLELINDVLDLAKVESGNIELSLESVEIGTIVADCLKMVTGLAEKRAITINHSGIAGAAVRADRIRFKQALLNLLSNAIKYNREGGSITLTVEPKGTEWLCIRVTDTGEGISDERLEELFQPFNRLGVEGSDIEGTGIGLTITQRLIEIMGGQIAVSSEVGVGSSFWIELPIEHSPEVNQSNQKSSGIEVAPNSIENIDEARHVVIYIEDNPSNIRLVAQILGRRKRIHLYTAHTPELGIELIQTHKPKLVLLDINLPGMDGFEVLELLKTDPLVNKIPVVAITANAMPNDVQRGKEADFAEYLTKPLDIERFYAIVDQYTEH